MVARTLSPWVGKVADANFHESCVFASKLSQTAEQNNCWRAAISGAADESRSCVRDEFAKVAAAVPPRTAATATGSARR